MDWQGVSEKVEHARDGERLLEAAQLGRVKVLKTLLARGAPIEHVRPGDMCRPIHAAARYGRIECLEALLEAGASTSATTQHGFTPLHLACAEAPGESIDGKTACVESLLAHGADPNAKNSGGGTPLDWAVSNDFSGCAEALLRKGALVNAKLNKPAAAGTSLLASAVESGHFALAALLMDFGVDPLRQGVDCFALARERSDKKMMGVLLSHEHYGASLPDLPANLIRGTLAAVWAQLSSLEDEQLALAERRIRHAVDLFGGTASPYKRLRALQQSRTLIVSEAKAKALSYRQGALFMRSLLVENVALARATRSAAEAALARTPIQEIVQRLADRPHAESEDAPGRNLRLYAAVVCVARWGDVTEAARQARREVADAEATLARTRAQAAVTLEALKRIAPMWNEPAPPNTPGGLASADSGISSEEEAFDEEEESD